MSNWVTIERSAIEIQHITTGSIEQPKRLIAKLASR